MSGANISQSFVTSGMNFANLMFTNATLTLYSGAMPASPETALGSNTALATFTFYSVPFTQALFSSSAGLVASSALFVNSTVTATASGTVTFARATPVSWVTNNAYSVGQAVVNGGNIYQCLISGTDSTASGPTGTAQSIPDGAVVWSYVGPGPSLMDYDFGTSGSGIILPTTTIEAGLEISITLVHSAPAV